MLRDSEKQTRTHYTHAAHTKNRLEEKETVGPAFLYLHYTKKVFCSLSCMNQSRSEEVKSSSVFNESSTATIATIIIRANSTTSSEILWVILTDIKAREGNSRRQGLKFPPNFKLNRWSSSWHWLGNQCLPIWWQTDSTHQSCELIKLIVSES